MATTCAKAYFSPVFDAEVTALGEKRGLDLRPSDPRTGAVPVPMATEAKEAFIASNAKVATVVEDWLDLVRICEGVAWDLDKDALRGRCGDGSHRDTSRLTSLEWVWRMHGRGIFMKFVGGLLRLFVPFANPGYRNTWHEEVLFSIPQKHSRDEARALAPHHTASDLDYTEYKKGFGIKDLPGLPMSCWWNNAGTICNVVPRQGACWGQGYLGDLVSMFSEAAPAIRSGDFILNKRDGPMAPLGGRHPQFFLFGDTRAPKGLGPPPSLLPVLSPYSDSGSFKDILIPSVDDWAAVTSLSFAPAFSTGRSLGERISGARPWCKRKDVLFFRGSATGPGTTPKTNARLALALAYRDDPFIRKHSNIGITAFSGRDRSLKGFISFLHPRMAESLGQTEVDFVPQADQGAYKYHVYAPGHSGASRMGCCLLSGALTFFMEAPEGTVAPETWLHGRVWRRLGEVRADGEVVFGEEDLGLLIKSDASNLRASLEWALDHDVEAKAMATRAMSLGSEVMRKEFIVDYLGRVLGDGSRLP